MQNHFIVDDYINLNDLNVKIDKSLNDCEIIADQTNIKNVEFDNCGEVSILDSLEFFFKSNLVETPHGFFQIFESLTFGDMLISFLLLLLVMLFSFKWLWEVLR